MLQTLKPRIRYTCGASLASLALGAAALPTAAVADVVTAQAEVSAQAQAAVLAAQAQGAALVAGRVTDENGAALPGARVLLRELGVEATTNFQGEFVLPAGTGGALTVEVEYLGSPTLTQPIDVAPAGRTPVDLVLSRGAPGEIVVTGSIVSGTARALNQQRQADNLTNIVSADDIGRFPDPNIAEALQRVPGIGVERDQGEGRYINIRGAPAEFTSVSVDGITLTSPDPGTRAIDLDTIPSDIVANLEISKTLLPWQEADSIAGAVNVVTRSPFDARGFRFSGMAGASYNQFGGGDRRASAFVSNVFGPERQFGALLSGSYSRTDRRVDNLESAWDIIDTPEGGEVFGVTENLFKDYDTRRERIAATGALEFRPAPEHRLFLRGSYARFEDDEYRNRLGILWTEGVLQPGATDATATFRNTRIEKQFRHRVQVNEIYTVTGGAEHDLGQARLDWNLGYTRSDQTYPNRNEILWRSSLRPTLSYDYADPDQPFISLFRSGEHLQEDRYAFRENTFRQNDTRNNEWSMAANLELPTNIGGADVSWRVGGRYRSRDVTADEERFRDRRASAAPTAPLSDFLSGTVSDNYDYLLGRKVSPRRAATYFEAARPQSERRMPQSITADYEASEDILGLYGSARLDLGATDIVAGLRMERTEFAGAAPTFNETTGAIGEARADSRYTSWFPNLTVRHAFTPDLIGRFALSRGINRPNFVELVPRVVENTESATVRVTSGNPALRPTMSNNADIGIEYYVRPLGVISANAFYKDLADYRYTLTRAGTYVGQPALLTRPENAPDGRIYGFELNWQQQFGFLPGLLSGFGIFANYTWTDSKIELAQPYAGRSVFPLPGQSRHMWNLSLFYERGPFNARVAYTKRSDYLDEINADDGRFDLYWEGRGQLDFTSSLQLSPNVGLFLEAKNLTNTPGVRYFGDRNRVYEYEKFGYNLFGGVRVNF